MTDHEPPPSSRPIPLDALTQRDLEQLAALIVADALTTDDALDAERRATEAEVDALFRGAP